MGKGRTLQGGCGKSSLCAVGSWRGHGVECRVSADHVADFTVRHHKNLKQVSDRI